MKKLIGLCVLLALMGCNEQKKPVSVEEEQQKEEDSTQFTENLEVDPELFGFHSYELGELVKNLMPHAQKNQILEVWQWDNLANDAKIKWVTEGYKEEYNPHTLSTMSYREGLARVHQLGERVSHLKDRKYEVPWSVRYEGTDARFGVNLITLQPKSDTMVSFNDPIPSLKEQGIKITAICNQSFAGEMVDVSLLEARRKQPVYLIDRSSGGSGGEVRWLELSLKDLSTEWCPDDNDTTI
ncbi:hypothetical protein [Acinetobacter piscicola]|uniref:hypothetical protein n=1 Tax=Acinetobacter piscicola TaxID=2006115 RepID=UPI001020BAC5|nr:hypothetical protein [Acinetobacter piscicola]RYL27204.1 hypothetical protein EWP19_07420 [Acinetobacter piscicola]